MTATRTRRRSGGPVERVEIDYFLLADAAEVLNGKVYLMGGGWDQIYVQDWDQPIQLSMAIGIGIPWNETNIQHNLTLSIQDLDGNPIEAPAEIGFTQGRPPTHPVGEAQHLPFVGKVSIRLPGAATYAIAITIDGERAKTFRFHARDGRPPGPTR